MPRLPLINRIKATEILDSDIIEINRKIPGRPGGTMLGLKTTVGELGTGSSISCVAIDPLFSEESGKSFLEEASTILSVLPILPSVSCYGPFSKACPLQWITTSFDPKYSSLDILKGIIAQPKEQWLAEAFGIPLLLGQYQDVWVAYVRDLQLLDKIFIELKSKIQDVMQSWNESSGNQMCVTNLTKYIDTIGIIRAVITEGIADGDDKINYLVPENLL